MKTSLARRVEVDVVRHLGRRGFLAMLAVGVGAPALVRLLAACSAGVSEAPPTKQTGIVRGTVTDAQGNPQAIGRIYLLLASGENQNLSADVDTHGAYDFGAVDVGSYQLRYWGGAQANVPEPNPNPAHVQVTANAETVTRFVTFHNPQMQAILRVVA